MYQSAKRKWKMENGTLRDDARKYLPFLFPYNATKDTFYLFPKLEIYKYEIYFIGLCV